MNTDTQFHQTALLRSYDLEVLWQDFQADILMMRLLLENGYAADQREDPVLDNLHARIESYLKQHGTDLSRLIQVFLDYLPK